MGFDREGLHHAYLLSGEPKTALAVFGSFLDKISFPREGNPDLFVYEEALFGIDEARRLNEQALRKPFGERKIFLLKPERLTLEAENALLKTLEEPVANTHFFLIVREEETLLPTLRSRMFSLKLNSNEEMGGEALARKFVDLSPAKRLALVKELSDEELSLPVFLDSLLRILPREKLPTVYPLRLIANDRSASTRLIVEHLALVL